MKTNPLDVLRRRFGLVLHGVALFLLTLCGGSFAGAASAASAPVVVIAVTGAIGPASADFIVRRSGAPPTNTRNSPCCELDTPGGLDTSMRQIIKAILALAGAGRDLRRAERRARRERRHLHPLREPHRGDGAGHQSRRRDAGPDRHAGGAPTPDAGHGRQSAASAAGRAIDAQSTTRKQVHDAAAYIRGLAQMRGRNADWAERAVREAVSLSASEALAQHVIDLIARDVPDLLRQAGRPHGHTPAASDVARDRAAPPIVTLAARLAQPLPRGRSPIRASR